MMRDLTAEIVAIGTEILLGEITDTNSGYIARLLRDTGINVYFMTTVGDNEQRIITAVSIALSRSDIVITCGGLGPTVDDVTRQAVARAIGAGLEFHQELMDQIAARFASFRTKMTANNRQQAYLPQGAIILDNPVGTAPSFIVESNSRYVISLPGVPREMKYLMTERVVPFLRGTFDLKTSIIKARVLKTAGIGESTLDSEIGAELLQRNNPTVGLAAHAGQVDIRITAKAESEAVADSMIAEVEAELRSRIGRYVFGVNNDRLASVLVQLLRKHGGRIAISETGLGDSLSQAIRNEEGGADVIARVEIYTDPASHRRHLGADPEIPLRAVAERTAERILRESQATAALAIVADPNIGDDLTDAESGTAVAVRAGGQSRSRQYGFGGKSDLARQWTSMWSLAMVWQILSEAWSE